MRSALVVIALALAGCYRPDVGACFLRCGSNNSCPDGLECNTQGICATTSDQMCSELPMIDADPDIDTPPPVMTMVTIEVLDTDFTPQNDIRIVFSTPTGQMIKEVRTPPNGHVETDAPVGSTVTIIRSSGNEVSATTYLDLWPDALIISRFGPTTDVRTVTVSWATPPAVPAGVTYFVYTTCFNGGFSTTNLTTDVQVSRNCPRFDVMLVAKSNAGFNIGVAVAPNVDGNSAVSVPQSAWQTLDSSNTFDASFMGLQPGTTTMSVSGYVTPAFANTSPILQTSIPVSGDPPVEFYPSKLGTAVSVTTMATLSTETYLLVYVERLPADTKTFDRDMSLRKLPLINKADLNLAMKKLTWPIARSSGVTYADPDVISAKIEVQRAGNTHRWHIIGRGNRIGGTPTMGELVLPDIPDVNEFEPKVGDTIVQDEITYVGVSPGSADAVLGRIESNEATLKMFAINGLMYAFRVTAI